MRILTPLLFPLAVLYDAVTSIRNRLYNTGVWPSARFDIPVVNVGNLSVGGTGKTPMVEYLIRLLADQYRLATLSRGYGRRTKGVRVATEVDNPATIGDEPYQFYRKFKEKVVVAVGEERAFAIPYILAEHERVSLILLDDAFQHRKVQPGFQILLTDYYNLFFNDFLLPAGRLRESKRGAARADVIVVTKCPRAISDDEMISIESAIREYSSKPVFFSSISYGHVVPVTDATPYKPEKIILVSGIANAAPLEAHLARNYELVRHFAFGDHHPYSQHDQQMIIETALATSAVVVTTEKDMVKMNPEMFRDASVYLYYLPIEIEFLKNGKEFDELVLNAVRSYAK